MQITVIPLAVLLVVLAIHLLVWRLFRPKNHISLVLLLFGILPFPLIIASCFVFAHGLAESILIFVGYYALAGIYVQTYPAIQAFSPSLRVILMIGHSSHGLSMQEIESRLSKVNVNMERFEDLFRESFIKEERGMLMLLPKGKILARIFVSYRNFLGLPLGAG